jgi:hypothetical protein
MRLQWPVLLVVLMASSVRADPAQPPTRVHLTFGAALPYQNGLSGQADHQTYVGAPGGWTQGWLLGAGFSVTRTMSLELEVSTTGVMGAREPSRYDTVYNLERQDRFLTLAARFRPGRPGGAVRIEPLAGVILASSRTWGEAEYYNPSNPGQLVGTGTMPRQDLGVRPGLVAGLDLRLGSARFAVVPSLRLQATLAGGTESTYPSHFPAWTIRPGLAVRAEF